MSVYVDDMRARVGRLVMCHMWADTLDELLAMADLIGVARRWLQRPPQASWVHFDIALSKRALAVKAGAIETDRFGPSEHCARLDIASGVPRRVANGRRMLDTIARVRAKRVKGVSGLPLFGVAS